MNNKSWAPAFIIMSLLWLVTFFLGSVSGWTIWRNLESIGVHKFITTGEVYQKKSKEKSGSGRRSYKAVINYYATYKSEDNKYYYDEQVMPSRMQSIQRGARYGIYREVLVDRYGDYVVTRSEPGIERNAKEWKKLLTCYGASFLFFGLATLSYKKMRKKKPTSTIIQ
jgi:hypothetical protein